MKEKLVMGAAISVAILIVLLTAGNMFSISDIMATVDKHEWSEQADALKVRELASWLSFWDLLH